MVSFVLVVYRHVARFLRPHHFNSDLSSGIYIKTNLLKKTVKWPLNLTPTGVWQKMHLPFFQKQAKPSWHFLRNWQNFSVHCPSSHLWSETDQNVLSHSYSRSIINVASQSAFELEAITFTLFSQAGAINKQI